MNKKDMFIREKLQQDKEISDRANKIFDNIKEEFKMENNEKKVIKISLGTFIAIAASLVIVGFVGINLYANSLGKPNIISGIQALVKNEPEVNVDDIAKELFEKGAYEIRKLIYGSNEYELAEPKEIKEINGVEYIKTAEKYKTVEEKYGEIFTGEALENVLSMRFVNIDGILYRLNAWGATGWDITNVEVEKINEENGELTYRVSYNDVNIDDSISDEKYTCEFKIKEVNGEYRISATNYCNLDGTEENDRSEESSIQDEVDNAFLYEKYSDLNWKFKENAITELEFDSDKLTIENGEVYIQKSGETKKKVEGVEGTAKYITGYGEQTLESVYIITEEGIIWKDTEWENGFSGYGLPSKFKKINFSEKVIDMTNGYDSTRIVEPPYFLLSTGELVNEEGSKYEELDGEFIYSFGNAYEQIFVSSDNTISYYDSNNREYVQIKDHNGNTIKIKDAFIQWSSIYNNLVEETGGIERIFIVDENGTLLYFDGYNNIEVKRYEQAEGKIVKRINEEKQEVEYGGHIRNIRVEFTDGTELLIKDANENYFRKN